MTYKNECVVCESKSLVEVANLGDQPLANNLIQKFDDKYSLFPLGLNLCQSCTHLQLSYFVDPNVLFRNYYYASGTSSTLLNYFKTFASQLSKYNKSLKKKNYDTKILEIASNDGSLLNEFAKKNFDVTGIDPASNLSPQSKPRYRIINDFYPSPILNNKYDFIIAQNVFAHNPNPKYFLESALKNLKEDGLILIQTSQAKMYEDKQFDTIYHEHFSFFSIGSMKKIARICGGFLNKIFVVDIHGGSFLFLISKTKKTNITIFDDPIFRNLNKNFCFRSKFICDNNFFQNNINSLAQKLHNELISFKENGYKIFFVGAAAKAIVVMNLLKSKFKIFPIDYVLDEAQLKIGKIIPNVNLKILPFEFAANLDERKVFVISAWNFEYEIQNKLKRLNLRNENISLIYYPTYNIKTL